MTAVALEEIHAPYRHVVSERVVSAARRLIDVPSYAVRAYPAAGPVQHSILELEGLGRDIWAGVDPNQYVDALRNEWNDR